MCKSSVEDEGRPFEVGFQQQASNHSKLLQSKVEVVSVRERYPEGLYDESDLMSTNIENRGHYILWDKFIGKLVIG